MSSFKAANNGRAAKARRKAGAAQRLSAARASKGAKAAEAAEAAEEKAAEEAEAAQAVGGGSAAGMGAAEVSNENKRGAAAKAPAAAGRPPTPPERFTDTNPGNTECQVCDNSRQATLYSCYRCNIAAVALNFCVSVGMVSFYFHARVRAKRAVRSVAASPHQQGGKQSGRAKRGSRAVR